MAIQANKHRREVDFVVSDKVYITTRNWSTDRPSRKIDFKIAGPFPIIKQVRYSFRLELLASMSRLHNVFSSDKLRKDPDNPLPSQHNPLLQLITVIPKQQE